MIGFCGGYTTFSAFSYETMALLQSGDYRRAVGYAVASVVISLLAMYAGLEFSRVLIAARRAA
jgi:CrcB protein